MSDIIKFCNENQGFFSAILSLCSLLVSIIAIFLSFYNSMLPYRKRLTFRGNAYEKDDKLLCTVEVVNVGKSVVYIRDAQIIRKKTKLHIGIQDSAKVIKIMPGEVANINLRIYDDEDIVRKNILDLNPIAYIEVFDTENKKYKVRRGFGVG